VKRKRYSRKFQRTAVERMRTCENVGELARELGVRPRCLYKWRAKLEALEPGDETARPSTHAATNRKENQRLKAEKTLEVDFSEVPCKKSRLDARRPAKLASWDLRADRRSNARIRAGSHHRFRRHVGRICDAEFNQPTKISYTRANSGKARIGCYL
jgi:hypothetical protein